MTGERCDGRSTCRKYADLQGSNMHRGRGVWTMTEESGLLGFSGTRDIYSELILKGATNCKGTENMVLN